MKIAFMFSGQGSQYLGMGRDLFDKFPIARKVFEDANVALGFNITDIIFNDCDLLNETHFTQPALLTTSVAYLAVLRQHLLEADFLCGLSLGEYTAYVASGAIGFMDAVRLVHNRGKYMMQATPFGSYLMCAITGLKRTLVLDLLDSCRHLGFVAGANFNSPVQTVIAGEKEAVITVAKMAKSHGAKFTTFLNTSGPFHTELLSAVSGKLLTELSSINIDKIKIPVVSNVTGKLVVDERDIAALLSKQVMCPVMWEESIYTLIDNGVDTFFEIGAGKILSSFVKQIDRKLTTLCVENVSGLEAAINFVGGIV